jgi:hypothetical protein
LIVAEKGAPPFVRNSSILACRHPSSAVHFFRPCIASLS